jgi:hypothetical protein
MDFKETGWGDMDCTDLVQDRDQWILLVNIVMNLQIPWHFKKFLSSWATGSFSRMTQLNGVTYLISQLSHTYYNVQMNLLDTYCNCSKKLSLFFRFYFQLDHATFITVSWPMNYLLVLHTTSLSLSVMVKWLVDLLAVCEEPSYNPGMETSYNGRGFLWFSSVCPA